MVKFICYAFCAEPSFDEAVIRKACSQGFSLDASDLFLRL